MPFDGRILSGVSVLGAVVEGGSFAKAAELIAFDRPNSTVADSLAAYPAAAQRYHDETPE